MPQIMEDLQLIMIFHLCTSLQEMQWNSKRTRTRINNL